MSWDIFIQDLPDVARVEDIPNDFEPAPLGERAAIVERIRQAVPDVDFSNPEWGVVEGQGWSMEFNIGGEDPCKSIMLIVRGAGEEAPELVGRIIHSVGARGLDSQTGEFFDVEKAKTSFAEWQAYRNPVATEDEPAPRKGFLSRLLGLN
jgi:hypothetical protein